MNVENFIRDNRPAFDETPPAGHWERFQQRQHNHRRLTLWRRWTVGIAASIALLGMASMLWQNPQAPTEQASQETPCDHAPDMQACYLETIRAEAGRIQAASSRLNPDIQTVVMDEVDWLVRQAEIEPQLLVPEELPHRERQALLSECYQRYMSGIQRVGEVIDNS